MPVARYWRLAGFDGFGVGNLSLSQIHLYKSGVRVGATLTPSSSHAPAVGALGDLSDASDATGCTWDRSQVTSSGFYLLWDFGGAPSDVDEIRVKPMDAALVPGRIEVYYQDAAGQWVLSPASKSDVSDPLASTVVLLVRFDGADGSTSVINEAPSGIQLACIGGAKLTSAGPRFGSACLLLSSATPGSVGATAASAALDLGSDDFSIEVFCYPTAFGGVGIVLSTMASAPINGFIFALLNDGRPYVSLGSGSLEFAACIGSSPLSLNTWQKLEYSRSGNSFNLFVDGPLVASNTSASPVGSSPYPLRIGNDVDGKNRPFYGKIDSVRISKGAARHVAAHEVEASDYPGLSLLKPRTADSTVQIAASAPVPAFSTRRAAPLQLARDVEHGGPGTIYGTTKTKGTPNAPTKARVVLQHQRSKLPVRETWSDPITGAFVFEGVDTNQQFLALAEDVEGHFRPVAANRLTPEVP